MKPPPSQGSAPSGQNGNNLPDDTEMFAKACGNRARIRCGTDAACGKQDLLFHDPLWTRSGRMRRIASDKIRMPWNVETKSLNEFSKERSAFCGIFERHLLLESAFS